MRTDILVMFPFLCVSIFPSFLFAGLASVLLIVDKVLPFKGAHPSRWIRSEGLGFMPGPCQEHSGDFLAALRRRVAQQSEVGPLAEAAPPTAVSGALWPSLGSWLPRPSWVSLVFLAPPGGGGLGPGGLWLGAPWLLALGCWALWLGLAAGFLGASFGSFGFWLRLSLSGLGFSWLFFA